MYIYYYTTILFSDYFDTQWILPPSAILCASDLRSPRLPRPISRDPLTHEHLHAIRQIITTSRSRDLYRRDCIDEVWNGRDRGRRTL